MSSAKTEAAASQALTPELKAFIAEWKSKPGNLIMVLHHVQEHFGYIPRKVAFEVADLLGVPLARIYGVITFCLLYTSPSPRDRTRSRMPSSA